MGGNDITKDLPDGTPQECESCRRDLQEYLDGTLGKKRSLELFLHLRDCPSCRSEHDSLRSLFGLLDALPDMEVPSGFDAAAFDAAVLAEVPYESYRAMAELRRERVPVFLEEHFLPAFVRSRATRLTGIGVSALATGGFLFVSDVPVMAIVAVAGLVPELAVRLQGLGRRIMAPGGVEG